MRTALLVVDMVVDFVDGVLANPAAKPIIEPVARALDVAREREDWMVIYGNDAHQPGDFELRIYPEHSMAGTPGAEVIPELAVQPGEIVVPKRYYSVFTQTDLDATLRVHQIERLVLTGQHADLCCRHTAYDGYCRGLEVVVAEDGTCVYGPGSDEPEQVRQGQAMDYIRSSYGARIVTVDELSNL